MFLSGKLINRVRLGMGASFIVDGKGSIHALIERSEVDVQANEGRY